MIGVLDVPEPGIDDADERGLIFPVPGGEKNTVIFEPRDGDDVQSLTATALEFKLNGRTAIGVRKVRLDLFVTDARFAFACSKYDKGGGWVGGVGTMIVFNAVSKTRAALRSRGKMLVGQVRYPWIEWVASARKKGWTSDEKLLMQCRDEEGKTLRLVLTLPKNIEAAKVAAEIACRAARYRLACGHLDEEAEAELRAIADGTAAPSTGEDTQVFELPGAQPMGEYSARLAPALAAFCTSCGETVAAEDSFCTSCGAAAS